MKPRRDIPRVSAKRLAADPSLQYRRSTITPKNPTARRLASVDLRATDHRRTRGGVSATDGIIPSGEPVRSKAKRKASPRRVNPQRKAKEFARCYGSKARVQWVKALPCAWCVLRSLVRIPRVSDNAHTESGGASRKADYQTIAPLCRRHHKQFDEYLTPFDRLSSRLATQTLAAVTETRWLAHLALKAGR